MAEITFQELHDDAATLITSIADGDYHLVQDISEPLASKKVKIIVHSDLVSPERTRLDALEVDPQVVTFIADGTWTKDAGLAYVIVELVGPGAGGAGSVQGGAGTRAAGAGGGAGGYSKKLILAAALGATEVITVGLGTAGGIATNADDTSESSSFGAHLTATGGEGGDNSPIGAGVGKNDGGDAGVGSGGDVNQRGGPGENVWKDSTVIAVAGNGGNSFFQGAGRGNETSTNGNGAAAHTNSGAGGGGGVSDDSAAANGGAGADGIVIVHEFYH